MEKVNIVEDRVAVKGFKKTRIMAKDSPFPTCSKYSRILSGVQLWLEMKFIGWQCSIFINECN